jgi:crotonobetainyl-CoA:carnitine CoA-transferase CaiB-like acyl-CoA transferase
VSENAKEPTVETRHPGNASAAESASAPASLSRRPLSGIKVVELGHIVAGPTASLILAEFGADVIKVERPGSGDQARVNKVNQGHFVSYNSNKRSVCLDLASDAGRETLLELLISCDVLIDNYAPGALDRMGLDFETLSKRNPRLIHCTIKGFLPGPYGDRPLTDEPAQMMGGLAYMTGPRGQPLRAGTSVVDITGAMFAAMSVLAALRERDQTGRGRQIHVGLFESVVFLVGQHIAKASLTGEVPPPLPERGMGRDLGWGIYRIFQTRDEREIFVAVLSDAHWERFCREFALDDLWADESLRTNTGRAEQYLRLARITEDLMRACDFDEAIRKLEAAKLPFSPVNTPMDLTRHAHVLATNFLKEVRAPDGRVALVPDLPIAASGWFAQQRQDPPLLGEHTQSVLDELARRSEIP